MKYLFTLSILLSALGLRAQELFVHTEPASTLPKKVLALRLGFENYQEPLGRSKYWTAARLMYGAGRKLTLIGTVSASNHHIRSFPGNLLQYFRNHHSRSSPAFPFLFEGVHLYGKYRIFSRDGPQKHLRVALYSEISKMTGVHDVAEPHLLGDNSGVGGGVIVTRLNKRFALSLTGGLIHPFAYKDSVVTFRSGNSVQLHISAGYRVFPASYSDYDDLNVNIYAEVINTTYSGSRLTVRGEALDLNSFKTYDFYTYQTLIGGGYSALRPSLQFIFGSDSRIDISTAIPLYKKSYLNFNPVLYINYQKYFYSTKQVKEKRSLDKIKRD